jgi:hypothetical protein
MTKARKPSIPFVRCGAGLHANQARRQLHDELRQLLSRYRSTYQDNPAGIDVMD